MRILLGQGLEDILFDMDPDQVVALIGSPDEYTTDKDEDMSLVFADYEERDMMLVYAEGEMLGDTRLVEIIVSGKDCELFGEKIENFSFRQMVDLFAKQNIHTFEEEVLQEEEEHILFFPEENIEFCFEQENLVFISFGK